jgi:hypothetical protein
MSRLYESIGRPIDGPEPEQSVIITVPSGDRMALWLPFPKQVSFHTSEVMNLLARGSRGSGKSDMLRWDAHMRGMSRNDIVMVLVRKTMKMLEESHILFIRKEMQRLGGYYHGTNHCAVYPTGSRLFFSYVGHEDDALNLLGAELAAAYFDELTTIPWDYFMKMQASVRVKRGSGIKAVTRSATNPFGESAAEVEKYFVHRDVDPEDDENYDPEDWGFIQINMEDNPHVDIEQYKRRFAGLAPHLRKAWLYGEYADEAALFDFKPQIDGRPYHVLEEIDLPAIVKAGQIYRAFDMGWHPDPAYCVWIAHLGNRYVVFHEKVLYKTIIPDWAEIIHEEDRKLGIREPNEEPGQATRRVMATFCDPSMDIHTGAEIRTNRGIFESHGVPMECSVNNRELFATVVHQALAEEAYAGVPRLQIYRGHKLLGCPYLVRSLPLQRFNEKRPMAMDNHQHDHPVVALAYFLISHAANERRDPQSITIPRWRVPKRQRTDRFILGDESVQERSRYR